MCRQEINHLRVRIEQLKEELRLTRIWGNAQADKVTILESSLLEALSYLPLVGHAVWCEVHFNRPCQCGFEFRCREMGILADR